MTDSPEEALQEPRRGRPQMPAGYGLAEPTADGLLPWATAVEKLSSARNYWICTTRPDGRPHAAPVWGLWHDGALYFSTDPRSRKARNLAVNPATVVHLESGDDTLILEGILEIVESQQLPASYPDLYDAKYGYRPDPTDPGMVTYVLRPQVALAWLEQDFPSTATRWQFE